jgi:WD40 repeat protein
MAHTILLLDVPARRPIEQLSGHRSRLLGLAMAPKKHLLASIDLHGHVKIWDWQERVELTEFHVDEFSNHDLAFSPDARLLAAPHAYGVTLWNVTTEKIETRLKNIEYEIAALEFSPDGASLGILRDRKALFWDVKTGKYHKPIGLRAIGFDFTFAPDRNVLAVAGGWSVYLYDVDSCQETAALRGHKGIVWSVKFSDDGDLLASASNDGTVRFWDPHEGQERSVTDWKIGKVYVVLFGPDGKTAIAGGESGDIVVWNVQ